MRSCPANPAPCGQGLYAACRPVEKCFTGNRFANVVRYFGALLSGMNTSETNSSGRIVALTTAGDASAFGMIAVTASPSEEKHAAPTASVTRKAGIVLPGMFTL